MAKIWGHGDITNKSSDWSRNTSGQTIKQVGNKPPGKTNSFRPSVLIGLVHVEISCAMKDYS